MTKLKFEKWPNQSNLMESFISMIISALILSAINFDKN